MNYLNNNTFHCNSQSAYRFQHCIVTLLLRITCDIFHALGKEHGFLLTLVDLLTVFHAIDHSILFDKVHSL